MSKKKTLLISIVIIIIIIIIIIGIALHNWLFPNYIGWKRIQIDKIGSFYVPKEWVFTKDGTVIYFTDKPITEEGYKIYLVGTVWLEKEWIEGKTYTSIEDIYPSAKKITSETLSILSNSASYDETVFEINNKKEKKIHVSFFGNINELDLYAWDNLLDIETVKKIAKSYLR